MKKNSREGDDEYRHGTVYTAEFWLVGRRRVVFSNGSSTRYVIVSIATVHSHADVLADTPDEVKQ